MFGFDLTTEQAELKELARHFAREKLIPVAAEYDEGETFPKPVCRQAWEFGLMNLEVPREYGGTGLGLLDSLLMVEELSYGCAGITDALTANGLAATPLLLAGSDAQKKEYLGRLTQDCVHASLCATAPARGATISLTYRKVGEQYVLNGVERFVSNGSVANWYVTFAALDRQPGQQGLSCFVFPGDLPGLRKTRIRGKLGQRAGDMAEVVFEEVTLPRQALVGEEGQGCPIATQSFDRTRPRAGALAIGICQRALDEATRYALERQQFGQPIADFQAIQDILANMVIALEAVRLLTYKAAWAIDQGAPASMLSSCAKAFGTDATMRVTTEAVQVFGGYGYMKEYPVEKLMRDAKMLQIAEGSAQAQRIAIAQNLLGR